MPHTSFQIYKDRMFGPHGRLQCLLTRYFVAGLLVDIGLEKSPYLCSDTAAVFGVYGTYFQLHTACACRRGIEMEPLAQYHRLAQLLYVQQWAAYRTPPKCGLALEPIARSTRQNWTWNWWLIEGKKLLVVPVQHIHTWHFYTFFSYPLYARRQDKAPTAACNCQCLVYHHSTTYKS